MIFGIFNTTVTVKRRQSIFGASPASRDSLNNPVYGAPTAGWDTIYTLMPARIALGQKPLQFATVAERITPRGVVYIPPQYTIYHEDRILTPDGIEYIVVSVVAGYVNNNVIDHWELDVDSP